MLGKLFGKKKKDGLLKEDEVRILLPDEVYTLMQWDMEGLPVVCMVNSGLKDFEPKEIFAWHLSVIIEFEDLILKGMPSDEEREIVDPFCDQLDEDIKAGGNALFFARETWNGTRRLVWRVYDPDIAHDHLQYLVDNFRHPRPFSWEIIRDVEWEQAKWYLDELSKGDTPDLN